MSAATMTAATPIAAPAEHWQVLHTRARCEKAVARSLHALRIDVPDFDADAFTASLPYEHAADRTMLRDALALAGL